MPHHSATVCVLMATYNGAAYIKEQTATIAKQATGKLVIQLFVSDDGSSDDTTELISETCKRLSLPLTLVATENNKDGHRGNFQYLCQQAMAETGSEFYAFSDQDDYWTPKKFELLHREIVNDCGPVLVHCDLEVVDVNLSSIASSFFQFQGLPDAKSHPFKNLLYQNVVTGCATLFNRELLDLATPIPQESVIHDHWFALVASLMGTLKFVERPLVKYRQHNDNAIGATATAKQRSYFSLHFYRTLVRFPLHLAQAVEQAKALDTRRLERGISVEHCKLDDLITFSTLKERSWNQRLKLQARLFGCDRSFKERVYLALVLLFLPWIPCRKSTLSSNDSQGVRGGR